MAKVIETWVIIGDQCFDEKAKWQMLVTVTTRSQSDYIFNHRHGNYSCELLCEGAISREMQSREWFKEYGFDRMRKLSFSRFCDFGRDLSRDYYKSVEKYNVGVY